MGNNSIKYPEYSKEDLINKVFEIENIFSDEEKNYIIDNFYKSLSFAEEKHKEQFRDSGEKYIEHLKRTLYNVFDLLGRCIPREYVSDLVVSSILHDVIEDTEITFQELEEEFGKNVRVIVGYITKEDISIYKGNKEERNKKYHEDLKQIADFKGDSGETIILKHLASIIKAADRIDNLNTMWSWDKEKIKKKIDETLDFIIPIYHKYHNKKIIKELHLAVNVAIKQIVRKEKNKS